MIFIPCSRVREAKNIPCVAAHTRIAHIWEYPSRARRGGVWEVGDVKWELELGCHFHRSVKIAWIYVFQPCEMIHSRLSFKVSESHNIL